MVVKVGSVVQFVLSFILQVVICLRSICLVAFVHSLSVGDDCGSIDYGGTFSCG